MFIRSRLSTAILDRIARPGFRLVEVFCARQHFDYRDRGQVADIAAWFKGNDTKLNSLHLPIYMDEAWGTSGQHARITITEVDKTRRIEAIDEIKRGLEIVESIPCPYAILHVGQSGEAFSERKMESAMTSIEHLRLFARQRGTSLLLENTPNDLSEADRLNGLLHELRFPDLGLCFDSGHAQMSGNAVEVWEKMAPLVRSTHLHDNDGLKDDHLFPGEGKIDWDALLPAMKNTKGDFPWLLEIHDPSGVEDPVTHAWDLFERWEEKLNS
jgi:sugar phosphate isomerase/epimerase